VIVARTAFKKAWFQGPSPIVAPSAACLVNTGLYRGNKLYSRTSLLAYRADGLFHSIYTGMLLGRVLGIPIPKIIGHIRCIYRLYALYFSVSA
jgi:hypothetical protein